MKYVIALIIAIFIFCSCERILYDDNPSNTFEENFELFWSDFNKYYAQFKIRNINWDSVYDTYNPIIKSTTSDYELYISLSEIVGFINDGHVNLYTPIANASCKNCLKDYSSSVLINPGKYIVSGPNQTYIEIIEYGNIVNNDIGYIVLKNFSGKGEGLDMLDERYFVIDEILDEFKNKTGLIIDVRGNTGGNSLNAETIASRFADKKRLFHRYYQKIGAGKDDFSDWYNRYIEPNGPYQYQKPVIVLTSRKTFSSAEIFVMAMQVFPHVTIVGDTTGGGIGNPIYRELPNGWVFRLSTKVGATADSYIIEGKGIPPDITAITTKEDSINGIDRILEKGIEIIENY